MIGGSMILSTVILFTIMVLIGTPLIATIINLERSLIYFYLLSERSVMYNSDDTEENIDGDQLAMLLLSLNMDDQPMEEIKESAATN